jgi:hypothetical protein
MDEKGTKMVLIRGIARENYNYHNGKCSCNGCKLPPYILLWREREAASGPGLSVPEKWLDDQLDGQYTSEQYVLSIRIVCEIWFCWKVSEKISLYISWGHSSKKASVN